MLFKIFIFLLFTFIVISSVHAEIVLPNTACRSERGGYCIAFPKESPAPKPGFIHQLAAVIPGVEFLGDIPINDPQALGEVVARLYVFLISIVGIAALAVFISGATMYMTAGDNEGRLKKARGWMTNAISGLALAFASWLIVNTINPELTKKLIFQVPIIGRSGISPGSPGGGQNQIPIGALCRLGQVCAGGICTHSTTGRVIRTGEVGICRSRQLPVGAVCDPVDPNAPQCTSPLRCGRNLLDPFDFQPKCR